MPTMQDRARQALVKLALEPEWEAKFEGNVYGFRPGRSTWDAIKAILNYICRQPKFVLDADIEKCFDKIDHEALLTKLKSLPAITALIRSWLKAGVVDEDITTHPEAGTPQGGVISPLLMNVALHGLESYIVSCLPKSRRPAVIRYADDLVILHPDLSTIQMLKEKAEAWLATIGLNLKATKTCITHTLHEHEGNLGFDFLGFTVRQFKVSKYHSRKGYKTHIRPSKANQKRQQAKLKELIYKNRGTSQYEVISVLNPKIRGWANYYRLCCAKRTFARMDDQLHYKLWRWACWRHHNKGRLWRFRRYWHHLDGRFTFTDGHKKLARFADTKIVRHPKVPADKSPFDGDWIYWAQRIGKAPDRSRLSVKLLNTQHGKCRFCKLPFTSEDILEVHHINGNHQDNRSPNLALMHGHCHDQVHNEQMARLRTVRQRARQLAATG